jgi:putative toxin-antitoxin system antitoxin component (TIGR02293 family)
MTTQDYKIDDPELESVNEAMRLYVKALDITLPITIKIGHMTYTEFFENKMLIIHAIRQGLPYEVFSKIKEIMPFTEDDWAEYLNISKKTLHRHKNEPNYLFKPIHTEKIIELAEVTNYGKGVFDSSEQFYLWLNTPSYALANLKPSELIKDSYGKELVMGELNRIEHGIFA